MYLPKKKKIGVKLEGETWIDEVQLFLCNLVNKEGH